MNAGDAPRGTPPGRAPSRAEPRRAKLGARAGGRPRPARPNHPLSAAPPATCPGAGIRGTATPSQTRRSLTLGDGCRRSAAGRGAGPRPASDGGAGPQRRGGGPPVRCRKGAYLPENRAFTPQFAGAEGAGGGVGGVGVCRARGKGGEERARRARSPLDRRIGSPAAAAGPP